MKTTSQSNICTHRTSRQIRAVLLPLSLASVLVSTVVHGADQVNASLVAGSCKPPEYPVASVRLEESGTTILSLHIGLDGAVIESKVQTSSGYDRLDQAAKAALSRCKFKPATVDGKPEQAWSPVSYKWKL